MSEELDVEFEKADIVSQYVYGMALLEIGIAALVKLEESDDTILDVSKGFIEKARGFKDSAFPIPREQ